MRKFNKVCAQGDIMIIKVDKLPANAVLDNSAVEGNYLVVTHSETGHHHVMERDKVKMFKLPNDIMKCLLVVEDPVALEHLREFDTHEAILFDKGVYEVRRQREYTPQGMRRVED